MTRLLGLDFGDKTTGVAVSDPLGWTARGLEVIRRQNPQDIKATVARVGQLALEYGAAALVLGHPVGMDGGGGSRAAQTAGFKKALEKALGLPVMLWDERLSTVAVNRVLLDADLPRRRREDVIDRQAAAYILQGYLDAEYHKKQEEQAMTLDEGFNTDDFEDDGDDVETIIMTGEGGEEVEYLILDEVEYEGSKYILVVESEDADDDESDAILFKQVGEDDEDFVYEVPTDAEFEAVAKILGERLDDYEIDCE